MMSKILRFGIKTGITSSAVYLTVDSGVWKDSETTTELYHKIKSEVKPYVKPIVSQIPFEIPQLPKTGDLCTSTKTAWNKGVMASCLFLVGLPDMIWSNTKKGIKYGYKKIREQLNSFESSEI